MLKLESSPLVIGLFIALLLQLILAPNLMIFGVSPDFLAIYLFILALVNPRFSLIPLAFAGGMMFDLLGVGPVGAMAFCLMLVSFALSRAFAVLNNDTIFVPLILVAVAALLLEFFYALFLVFTGNLADFWAGLLFRGLPAALMNTVLCLLLLPLLRNIIRTRSKSDEAVPVTHLR